MKTVENEIRANWKQLPANTKKNMPSFSGKARGRRGQLERFENIGKNGDEETEVESFGTYEYSVQRIWQSFTNSAFRFTRHSDHIFIALSLVVSLNNILRFPVICSESGGILFLIPYGLCLIFITMPIIYLENALGQYSSLPPMQLFYHLCPAFGGLGLAMSLVAISKSILLSYSAMGIFYAFKSMTAAVSTLSQTNWLECVHQSYSSCYDPYIKCNEAAGSYQHYSKCYDLQVSDNRSTLNYTWEQVVILMTSTSEALREFPPNIYWTEKINKPGKPSEFFFASATAEQAIIAVIAMLGMRFYAKLARLLVTFPQLCMIICIIFAAVKIGFRNMIASIAKGFSPDQQEFFDLRVWVTAALQAMVATNLLDGSYITLAAMKDFRNNFMRDTFLVVAYGLIINLFGCFFVFSVSGAAAKLMFPMNAEKGCNLVAMLWKHGENIYFIVLSLLFAKTTFGAIILSLTYFSLFLCTIGTQVLALEMIIMTVYRTVVRIKFIESSFSRNMIICTYFLFMYLYTFIYGRTALSDVRVRYFYFALVLSVLAFLELLVSIHIYRLKRFIVNLHTMLGEPPSNLWRYLGYPINWYWTACWYIITPTLCVILGILALFTIVSGRLYSDITVLKTLITLFPLSAIIIIMIIHAIRAHRTGKTIKSLFIADLRWAPELGTHRQQALYEERAARVFI